MAANEQRATNLVRKIAPSGLSTTIMLIEQARRDGNHTEAVRLILDKTEALSLEHGGTSAAAQHLLDHLHRT